MPTRPKVTIVTLCYNKWELTSQLLTDLYDNEFPNIDRIVVVDNGSDSITSEGLRYHKSLQTRVGFDVLSQKENTGFTLAANMGLRFACHSAGADDVVFLISNDVRLHGKFIEQTLDIFTDGRGYLVGHKLLSHDTGWNTFGDKTFPYLEGYFLATTAFGWDALGYFDKAYAPYDYEDVDLSTQARKSGYKLMPLNNPAIQHRGGGTLGYNPEREAITRRNQEYFKLKWVK